MRSEYLDLLMVLEEVSRLHLLGIMSQNSLLIVTVFMVMCITSGIVCTCSANILKLTTGFANEIL